MTFQPQRVFLSEIPSAREVIEYFQPMVQRVLGRLGVPRNEVEDAAQQVFIVVTRKLPSFLVPAGLSAEEALRVWIYAICRKSAVKYRREARLAFDIVNVDDVELRKHDQLDPEADANRRQQWVILSELLATLSPERRAILLWHDVEGCSMPEIAQQQQFSEDVGSYRLRMARQDLKRAARRLTNEERAVVAPFLAALLIEEQRFRRSVAWLPSIAAAIAMLGMLVLSLVQIYPAVVPSPTLFEARQATLPRIETIAPLPAAPDALAIPDTPSPKPPLAAPTTLSAVSTKGSGGIAGKPMMANPSSLSTADHQPPARERNERVYVQTARDRLAAGRPDIMRAVLRSQVRHFPVVGYSQERAALAASSRPK